MSTSVPPPAPPEAAPPGPAPEEDVPRWGAWTAPAAIVTGLALGVFADAMLSAIASAFGSPVGHPTPAVSLLGDVLFDLALVGAALYFAATRGGVRARDFGYVRIPLRRAVTAVLAAGAGYYVVTLVYASIFSLHANDKLPSELGVHRSTAALIATAVFVCVIAPIAEELFFRGFLFGALRGWRGPWVAAVIVGVLFGFAHLGSAPVQDVIPLGFFGFVLCVLRWRTRSLYPGMALHALNNALALGVNDLHWSALGILGLMAAAIGAIGAFTLPLAAPARITSAA